MAVQLPLYRKVFYLGVFVSFVLSVLWAIDDAHQYADDETFDITLEYFTKSHNVTIFAMFVCAHVSLITELVIYFIFHHLTLEETSKVREFLFDFFTFRAVFLLAVLPYDTREVLVWATWYERTSSLHPVV